MTKKNIDKQKVDEILSRGVAEIIEVESLKKKLLSGKRLRIKLGIDPTSPNVHLGRSVTLLKLRDFQELGHQIVFVVGDFTAVIGDTSDKESERPMLSADEVKNNLKTYVQQVNKIIDVKKAEINYNSTWLKKLNYQEISLQANVFSVAEFTNRENIKKRLDLGKRVSLREVLYPIMQGYDSVALKTDVEIGGTDQRFNLLAGRKLQEFYKQPQQDLLMTNLIEGTDGRKMSSSWGNVINVTDESKEMFGKIMSLRDELIIPYFIHCTRIPLTEVDRKKKNMERGGNPRDAKFDLATAIVGMYFSPEIANKEGNSFNEQFSLGKAPDDIKMVNAKIGDNVLDLIVRSKLIDSKSQIRRLLKEGAIKINQEKVFDEKKILKKGDVVQVGKRRYFKLK